jgi:catechol 2,3-dioxygenase-like lactoylglutathione lyase family enzyme
MLRRVFLFVAAAVRLSAGDITGIDSIGITVSDLDRSVDFYTRVLHFQKVSEFEVAGDHWEHLTGVFGMRARTARLRLGGEFIELTEYLAPRGRAVPPDSRSNDRWFQHIAIITADMARAYEWLRGNRVRHASSGPQRLPDWNRNAGGIEAFYFFDPDGHALEILAFPPDKGAAKWHQTSSELFLGIDHTAIVISSTEASKKFYENVLGFHAAGESENSGPEQERLNNVFGARLRITAMRVSDGGPGIEFLEYIAPAGGRAYPADAQANDLVHWQTRLQGRDVAAAAGRLRQFRSALVSTGVVALPGEEAGFGKSIVVRDPDGHAIQIVE